MIDNYGNASAHLNCVEKQYVLLRLAISFVCNYFSLNFVVHKLELYASSESVRLIWFHNQYVIYD